jgi:hypothetical protein
MEQKIRLPFDRRSGEDRRKTYRLGYFVEGGVERRSGKERRSGAERRADWVRVSEWSGAYAPFADLRGLSED